MDAAAWFNAQSFHQPRTNPAPKTASNTATAWDSWDADSQTWKHYALVGGLVVETDEVGIPLEGEV